MAGATASGKSSVVKEIVRLLNAEDRVASVTQDCFYKDLSPEEREQAYQSNYNFDHPNAFDWEQQLSVLQQLRDGGKRCMGKGVSQAVANVNEKIAPLVIGKAPRVAVTIPKGLSILDRC